MSIIHNRAAALKPARLAKMACSIAIVAFSVASCSAVETTLLSDNSAPKIKNEISHRVSAPKKSYAYDKASVTLVSSVEAESEPAVAVTKVNDLGSSPYTCSPSGFGQKARCYLR
jgi:hypothetical protein